MEPEMRYSMKRIRGIVGLFVLSPMCLSATCVKSPDGNLELYLDVDNGVPIYSVNYKGKSMLEKSTLGITGNGIDFSSGMRNLGEISDSITRCYENDRIKRSHNHFEANRIKWRIANDEGNEIEIEFLVGNNDVAYRYNIPLQGETASLRVMKENSGFRFPEYTMCFATSQSDPMIGWKRTKPSYEEEYLVDAPLGTPSQYGHGFTFPALFRISNSGWVLLSETGVDSRYCGSRLSDYNNGEFRIAYPMPEENNGNGTSEPGIALPGSTPWRTITVGDNLAPIVETTVMWDLVEPRYKTRHDYSPGKGTWSWILWQDGSINIDDQKRYIDLAADMNYPYVLIDNFWDKNIGREGIDELVEYGRQRNVKLILWYSSSGYWNDIRQSPVNKMDNSIERKREMQWLEDSGIAGIKVDFFGGDKQETMRLYEGILSDADDHGLMVIFHGCTLPRGWEEMYPNYVGSEAVLASENMIFTQKACDLEALKATLHPFIRNSVGSMEFGGSFLNRYMSKDNKSGNQRRTSDLFSLATAVIYQSPAQHFALAPNNLNESSAVALEFLKQVPTRWDDTRFIDGYPGKSVIMARRHRDIWYAAGVNATDRTIKNRIKLPGVTSRKAILYYDGKNGEPHLKSIDLGKDGSIEVSMLPESGFVIIYK